MTKYKFNPDWLDEPEIMKEILQERDEIINEQAEKIKQLKEALLTILEITKDTPELEVFQNIVEKTLGIGE